MNWLLHACLVSIAMASDDARAAPIKMSASWQPRTFQDERLRGIHGNPVPVKIMAGDVAMGTVPVGLVIDYNKAQGRCSVATPAGIFRGVVDTDLIWPTIEGKQRPVFHEHEIVVLSSINIIDSKDSPIHVEWSSEDLMTATAEQSFALVATLDEARETSDRALMLQNARIAAEQKDMVFQLQKFRREIERDQRALNLLQGQKAKTIALENQTILDDIETALNESNWEASVQEDATLRFFDGMDGKMHKFMAEALKIQTEMFDEIDTNDMEFGGLGTTGGDDADTHASVASGSDDDGSPLR